MENMSSRNNNQINIPEAREAMDQFKMEAAREVGVDLKKGYNGHLTSREAGSVGGARWSRTCVPYEQRNMVEKAEFCRNLNKILPTYPVSLFDLTV